MSPSRTTSGRLSRRELLRNAGVGVAGAGLAQALHAGGLFSPAPLVRIPARAKRCIFLFMFGGPSQMDLFDYKPELQRSDGKTAMLERRRGEMRESVILGSKRRFQRYGETGQWCSDALPLFSQHMDKLAVVKSLYTDSFAHGSGILQMNTGQTRQGHPAMGAWVDYGLGSQNPDLPSFVVMHDPRGGPISGPPNWSSGYMPARHQGTLFRSGGDPLLNLAPAPTGSARSSMSREMQRAQIDLIRELDRLHAEQRPSYSELPARADTYRLAYRMEETAREALDVHSEPAETRAMYGLDEPKGPHSLSIGPGPFGRQCLIARRLLERDVRFVQIYQGGGHQQQSWDAHHGVEENLRIHCPEIDMPISALLTDLERTGLLDDTLVIWGGEFGRMPVSQLGGAFQVASAGGRDHNPKGFTMWLAGAGVKPGAYGETDELGHVAVSDRHHIRDLHATVLHLLGLDHEELTYSWGGLDRKLTGVIHATPIRGVMA